MLVGEQPGDQEDRRGHPSVGPSGRLLDEALEAGGIDRRLVYVTNAVKHFKFVRIELTKRRLHKKPTAAAPVGRAACAVRRARAGAPRVLRGYRAGGTSSGSGRSVRAATGATPTGPQPATL